MTSRLRLQPPVFLEIGPTVVMGRRGPHTSRHLHVLWTCLGGRSALLLYLLREVHVVVASGGGAAAVRRVVKTTAIRSASASATLA